MTCRSQRHNTLRVSIAIDLRLVNKNFQKFAEDFLQKDANPLPSELLSNDTKWKISNLPRLFELKFHSVINV